MGAQYDDQPQQQQEQPENILVVGEEQVSPSTVTTLTAVSVNPELLRAKGQAGLFVFFQSALLVCFLPLTYWIFPILFAILGFYAVKSGKLGWNYFYFTLSCLLYFAISLFCAAITFQAAYYLDTLYAISSFLLSLAFIIIYAMNLKNYTRHIKLLKNGAYEPLATIELVSEEPETIETISQPQPNYYPAQQLNIQQQQSRPDQVPMPMPMMPMPMMVPINNPYGQAFPMPQQQQQQQQQFYPVQYYYAVPNFGGVDKQ